MKTSIRLIALIFVTVAASTLCRANWYNHPVCTTAGVILKWHSTYHDYNGYDFTSSDAPGGTTIPAANLRGIYERAPVINDSHGHSTHTRGGSFPVWNGPSQSSVRGWINVLVYYKTNDSTIDHVTWTYTSGSGNNTYPTKSW